MDKIYDFSFPIFPCPPPPSNYILFIYYIFVDGEMVIDTVQGQKFPRFLVYDLIRFLFFIVFFTLQSTETPRIVGSLKRNRTKTKKYAVICFTPNNIKVCLRMTYWKRLFLKKRNIFSQQFLSFNYEIIKELNKKCLSMMVKKRVKEPSSKRRSFLSLEIDM